MNADDADDSGATDAAMMLVDRSAFICVPALLGKRANGEFRMSREFGEGH
jgi:hypothetical protein